MSFAVAAVSESILAILDGILAAWPTLPAEVRQEIERAVRDHGPAIGKEHKANAASAAAGFLDALWPVRRALPAEVSGLLEAGQVSSEPSSGNRRSVIGSLSDERRDLVLQQMVSVAEFRLYRNPIGLAAQVDELLDAYWRRLADEDRAEVAELRATHVQRVDDPDDAETYLRAIKSLLQRYPSVWKLLDDPAVQVWDPGQQMRSIPKLPVPPLPVITDTRSIDSTSEDVTRYANVHFPSKVLIDQDAVPLIVHVAGHFQSGAKGAADEARMSLKISPLTVLVRPEGFDFVGETIGGEPVGETGSHARQVKIEKERDCEPLVFFLKPQSAGMKRISVDFEQFSRRILTVSFEVEVVRDAAAMTQLTNAVVTFVPIASPVLGAEAKPPDLELRIMLSADRKTLDYMLHSPKGSDYNFKRVGAKQLRDDPLTFLQQKFDRLSDLAKQSVATRSDDETRRANRELAAIGTELYNELFSDELKREYSRVLRKKYRGQSLLITTDDPWIPWELVTPQDPGGDDSWDTATDPPLCETFRLSRWVAGRGSPDQLKLVQGVWVAPPDNLEAAQAESDYFTELHRRQWTVSFSGPLKTLDEVDDALMAGSAHLYHLACHGNFDAASANESKLKLGNDYLTPGAVGAMKPYIRRSKPVVFLNACHSGRVGIGLTRLGGWAETFLDCDASVFIGALWEVNDVLAARFAQEFYDRLWGLGAFEGKRQPIGQAFHEARLAIKQADAANPTWLAYVLYGDPYGQVVLGA